MLFYFVGDPISDQTIAEALDRSQSIRGTDREVIFDFMSSHIEIHSRWLFKQGTTYLQLLHFSDLIDALCASSIIEKELFEVSAEEEKGLEACSDMKALVRYVKGRKSFNYRSMLAFILKKYDLWFSGVQTVNHYYETLFTAKKFQIMKVLQLLESKYEKIPFSLYGSNS
jgi:hypothetical protein